MSLFVSLKQVCTSASLYDVVFYFNDRRPSTIQSMGNPPPHYIIFHHLHPWTVFVNLQAQHSLRHGPERARLLFLASSWPHLETFTVNEHHDHTPSSALTLDGFLKLLERCKSPQVLHFMFDTRGYGCTDIPQGHPWRSLSMPQDACINVLNTPIEEASVEALSVFFHVASHPDFTLTTQ